MQIIYQIIWLAIMPFLPLYLLYRTLKGKEEISRLKERLGYPKHKQKDRLIWIHAASIGEVNSIIPLIKNLHNRQNSNYNFLLTTSSRNGQNIAAKSVPDYVDVQYLPLDYPNAAKRFIKHYKPFAALWIEQELWPNLLQTAKKYGTHLALINGRLTQKSMQNWQKIPAFSHKIASLFDCILAGSPKDQENFIAIGFKAKYIGNLKALPQNKTQNVKHKIALQKNRKFWLAASIHKGEENLCLQTHNILKKKLPEFDFFLILVPRYPHQAKDMAKKAKRQKLKPILYSHASVKEVETADCLIIDAFGVLKTLYAQCNVAFLGGSTGAKILGKNIGGHNPLEAIAENCSVITGRDMHNFSHIAHRLQQTGALQMVDSKASSIAEALHTPMPIENGIKVLQQLTVEAEQTASYIANWLEERV